MGVVVYVDLGVYAYKEYYRSKGDMRASFILSSQLCTLCLRKTAYNHRLMAFSMMASLVTSLKSVAWSSMWIPSNRRRRASLEEAKIIFDLTLASSGDLGVQLLSS